MTNSNRRVRQTLLRGLVFSLPLLVTWFLLSFVLQQVHDGLARPLQALFRLLARWVPALAPEQPWMRIAIPVLGVVIALASVFAVGIMASHYLGKRVLALAEESILRVPLVRGVYAATKQIVDGLRGESLRAFEHVVLVEYPRPGLLALAFVTRRAGPKVSRAGGGELVYIFVPTSPNPTSGILLLVPADSVRDTSLGVEEAIKIIVSGGMIPESTAGPESGNPTDAAFDGAPSKRP